MPMREMKFVSESRRGEEALGFPGSELIADLDEFSASEFEREEIRFVAFDERGGGKQGASESGDFPDEVELGGLLAIFGAGENSAVETYRGRNDSRLQGAEVRPVEFGQAFPTGGRMDGESQDPHAEHFLGRIYLRIQDRGEGSPLRRDVMVSR